MLKLLLVAVLTTLIVPIGILRKKAREGNAEEQLSKMEKLGKMTLVVGVSIVILAVLVFHSRQLNNNRTTLGRRFCCCEQGLADLNH